MFDVIRSVLPLNLAKNDKELVNIIFYFTDNIVVE